MQYRGTPQSPCELELTQQEAERIAARAEAERRQHAREHEELLAKEAAIRYASEEAALKRYENKTMLKRHHVSCVVPALTGDTLKAARRAIDKAHCRLGKVREPDRHHGTLVVVGQSLRRGVKRAGGTVIVVTMGTARSRRHRSA